MYRAFSMWGDHQSAAYVAQYAAAGIDLSSHLEALQVDRMLFTSIEWWHGLGWNTARLQQSTSKLPTPTTPAGWNQTKQGQCDWCKSCIIFSCKAIFWNCSKLEPRRWFWLHCLCRVKGNLQQGWAFCNVSAFQPLCCVGVGMAWMLPGLPGHIFAQVRNWTWTRSLQAAKEAGCKM